MHDLIIVAVAYCLGCLQTGYYWVRFLTGRDLRCLGSGGTGARNAGRVLGRRGFVLTLLGDVGKGALAVALAVWLCVSPWAVAAVLVAVTVGHVWPVQLRFHGGRGVAVGIGALVVYDVRLFGILVAVTLLGYVITRRFQASGLAGFAVVPCAAGYFHGPGAALAGVGGLSLIVLVAHRSHILRWLGPTSETRGGSTVKSGDCRHE